MSVLRALNHYQAATLCCKPVAIFLCAFVVVAALTQIAGRSTLYFASEFTPQLNALLASKRIRLEGVSAEWNGLNPVLRVAQVTFGPGQLQRLEVSSIPLKA